ncbi:MAG: metallophosphoesterase [Phycisphaerae bacterium]
MPESPPNLDLPDPPALLRPDRPDPQSREEWALLRRRMEDRDVRTRRRGPRSALYWWIIEAMAHLFLVLLTVTFQYRRGYRNALQVQIRQEDIELAHLPRAFDGYRILQLTDLHLDGMEELVEVIRDRLEQVGPVDLAVLTGDFRSAEHGDPAASMELLAQVVPAIVSRRKPLAILGNHDSVDMLDELERMGLQVLINESITIDRDGDRVRFVGTDDVHYYYTPAAMRALADCRDCFSIALVHSPELAPEAAEAGASLYLCGHTHGGQICLPAGRAVLTHLSRCRKLYRGRWQIGSMQGRTSVGLGTSSAAVRFNCPPELVVLTLRSGKQVQHT